MNSLTYTQRGNNDFLKKIESSIIPELKFEPIMIIEEINKEELSRLYRELSKAETVEKYLKVLGFNIDYFLQMMERYEKSESNDLVVFFYQLETNIFTLFDKESSGFDPCIESLPINLIDDRRIIDVASSNNQNRVVEFLLKMGSEFCN